MIGCQEYKVSSFAEMSLLGVAPGSKLTVFCCCENESNEKTGKALSSDLSLSFAFCAIGRRVYPGRYFIRLYARKLGNIQKCRAEQLQLYT